VQEATNLGQAKRNIKHDELIITSPAERSTRDLKIDMRYSGKPPSELLPLEKE
jgi:hypothetical protein